MNLKRWKALSARHGLRFRWTVPPRSAECSYVLRCFYKEVELFNSDRSRFHFIYANTNFSFISKKGLIAISDMTYRNAVQMSDISCRFGNYWSHWQLTSVPLFSFGVILTNFWWDFFRIERSCHRCALIAQAEGTPSPRIDWRFGPEPGHLKSTSIWGWYRTGYVRKVNIRLTLNPLWESQGNFACRSGALQRVPPPWFEN